MYRSAILVVICLCDVDVVWAVLLILPLFSSLTTKTINTHEPPSHNPCTPPVHHCFHLYHIICHPASAHSPSCCCNHTQIVSPFSKRSNNDKRRDQIFSSREIRDTCSSKAAVSPRNDTAHGGSRKRQQH